MKKFFYGFLILAFVAAAYVLIMPKKVPVEVYEMKYGLFEETFSSDGKVHTRDKRVIYAFANGAIEDLKIKIGDLVTKNQIVGVLEWDQTHSIKSPIDGVISKVFRDSKGPVTRGDPLFEVSSLSELEVVADVLTPDVIRLNINGEARIQNWGGSEDLAAKIVQISRAGAVKTSALGVEEERTEVKLAFAKVPKELKDKFGDNYHVDVLFVVSRNPHALALPLGALFKNHEQWAVYVVKEGLAELREVKFTKRNDRSVLITEGLREGDQVILFPGDRIQEGTRVKKVF